MLSIGNTESLIFHHWILQKRTVASQSWYISTKVTCSRVDRGAISHDTILSNLMDSDIAV